MCKKACAFQFLKTICTLWLTVMLLCMPSQAFDVLERLDPNPEFYEAKRGAAVGVFQAIIAGMEQVRQTCLSNRSGNLSQEPTGGSQGCHTAPG
jgi:hypothetical protein